MYALNIRPGSRSGGTDKRVVEIFWGKRPFETKIEGRNFTALTEEGATLLFALDDNGHVIVTLYPANTENRKPVETCITLYIWLDPKRLLDKSFLKNCWKYFMAYMEYTSLDGNPTTLQRLKISYLRNFKHLVIDNKWTPTKFSKSISRIRDLVVAACFSGAVLIYFVNVTTKPKTTETDTQLENVNKNLEVISKYLNDIQNNNKEIKSISSTTDSIIKRTEQILKKIEK